MTKTKFLPPLLCLLGVALSLTSGTGILGAESPPRTLTRVFFQDDSTRTVKWADLQSSGEQLSLTPAATVPGFPQLDGEHQNLVQMEAAKGLLLVGVRDDEEGQFGSGWILVDTGIDEEEHGDHSHWSYPRAPRVRSSLIDKLQGNPAHLYCYNDVFYLANDKKNGYTRLDPALVKAADDAAAIRQRAVFHPGGGGHITLAATRDFGYSSWIDREGTNRGRVDITPLTNSKSPQIVVSFQLPHGGIHGATANQGKVFFAPADGICWIDAKSPPPRQPEAIPVQHISLGKSHDKPRRTGAFTTFGRYVAYTTGAGADAALELIDAAVDAPAPHKLGIAMAEGNRPSGLELVQPRRGSPLAFLFHDHPVDVEAPNLLLVIELDPNEDGALADAKVSATLEVGRSRSVGHGGHHSLAFDSDRRHGVFSNPGDGNLSVIALAERKVVQTFAVGGTPSKVLAIGGRGSGH